MKTDIEITGVPVVSIEASSTATEGAFYAYLEDVAPDGRVTYITEGSLRALDRKTSDEKPPYEYFGPYHSFEREDGEPLVPGEIARIEIGLSATSVRVEAGHRIRVAIAGHDASTFVRLPENGTPEITVYRNGKRASFIELPVKEIP